MSNKKYHASLNENIKHGIPILKYFLHVARSHFALGPNYED